MYIAYQLKQGTLYLIMPVTYCPFKKSPTCRPNTILTVFTMFILGWCACYRMTLAYQLKQGTLLIYLIMPVTLNGFYTLIKKVLGHSKLTIYFRDTKSISRETDDECPLNWSWYQICRNCLINNTVLIICKWQIAYYVTIQKCAHLLFITCCIRLNGFNSIGNLSNRTFLSLFKR